MNAKAAVRALFFLAVIGFASAASADPITYEISGIASGTIGGTTFTNALVRVILVGNTNNVVQDPAPQEFPCSFCYANPGPVAVLISGLPGAFVTQPTGIFSFAQPVDIDDNPGTPPAAGVVIGTLDNPPTLDGFTGLAGVFGFGAPFIGYDLKSTLPSFAAVGGVGYPTGLSVSTTRGPLSFTQNIDTGSATFTATVTPEPASLLLLSTGVAVLARRSRSRNRRDR